MLCVHAAAEKKAEDPIDAGMADASDEPVVEEVVTVDEGNPFFVAWDTPYGIPPFDSIRDEHYKPAFEAGIEELRNDIAVIRDNPEPPTFENTFEALSLAGESLTKVRSVFGKSVVVHSELMIGRRGRIKAATIAAGTR